MGNALLYLLLSVGLAERRALNPGSFGCTKGEWVLCPNEVHIERTLRRIRASKAQ